MTNITNSFETKRRGGLIGGLFLVGLGLYLLVAQFIRAEWMGMLILPGLSLIFLAWGLFTRNAGLLVPGGILGGIALSAYLTSNTFKDGMDVTQGAVFLLAFAAGWALITVLSLLIGKLRCTGLPVHLSLPPQLPALTEAQRLALYRAAQESLTNTHKHAGAKNIWLYLSVADASLTLTAADDGRGLPANPNGGFGLRGLRERAAQAGGELELGARPGGGAQVTLTVPLNNI